MFHCRKTWHLLVHRGLYLIIVPAAIVGVSSCRNDRSELDSLQARVQKLETLTPGVGEVMSAVQLHFAKLYFAGENQNWGLADFEIHEVEENLELAAALRPEENGTNLTGLVDAFEKTQLATLNQSIQQKDVSSFRNGYAEAITICNGCHQETGRTFIAITLPSAPPVMNQRWTPPANTNESEGQR